MRHDISQFYTTGQSITNSLFDVDKDYTEDIRQFINRLIPNYDSIQFKIIWTQKMRATIQTIAYKKIEIVQMESDIMW